MALEAFRECAFLDRGTELKDCRGSTQAMAGKRSKCHDDRRLLALELSHLQGAIPRGVCLISVNDIKAVPHCCKAKERSSEK